MARLDAGKYSRNIKTFTFREHGAITIPELSISGSLGRKTCYALAVDIIIESVTRIPYKNYRVDPPTSFYGYATLVEQDCLRKPVELVFGRQRIYEKSIPEAFQCWNNLAFWDNTEKRFAELLARLVSGNNSIINVCDVDSYPFDFEDISLREVYVKCSPLTQFRIEIYWVSPIQFDDDCGKTQDGKSKKIDDPKKDKGLPPSGSNPKVNDPSTPYSGNNPEAVPDSQSPYRNEKEGSLDLVDPNNSAPTQFWVKATTTARFAYLGCDKIRNEEYVYYLSAYDETVSLVPRASAPTGCNDRIGQDYNLVSRLTGQIVGASGVTDTDSVSLSYGTGVKPDNRIYVT